MKVLALDVYPNTPYRIAKDNNGGYGTANELGDSFVAKFLTWILKRSMDYPPLSAVTILGQLRQGGHEIAYAREIPSDAYDLYLIPTSIVAHETEIAVIKALCEGKEDALILAFGPFATTLPEPYIAAGAKVLAGDPEVFFQNTQLTIEKLRDLPSFYSIIGDLNVDRLAIPAWDVVLRAVKTKMGFLGKGVTVPIIAGRGCPYSCSHYCVYPLQQGKKVRSRSPDLVVNEMLQLQKNLGIVNFQFRDPVFTINRKYVEALCNAIIATKVPFRFAAEFHLKDIDNELASLLHRAGLRLAFVGIESVSASVLSNAKRMTIPIDAQYEKVKLLQKAGVRVKAMYIFGLPMDTDKTIDETINYALNLNSDYGQFSVFTPYPGTPVFEEYKDKIIAKKYENFTQWRLVFSHDYLTAQDVRDHLSRAYTKYYTHPRWILNKILSFFK
jgi:anaerobic magnesium-protoporphyrin IX monomethyl ester cyclase